MLNFARLHHYLLVLFFFLFTLKIFAISDGTTFSFVNQTEQKLVLNQTLNVWFNHSIGQSVINPGEKKDFYLEGRCSPITAGDDAATVWFVYSENNPNDEHIFTLKVINKYGLNCAKRLFSVDGQFRKIELGPIGNDEKSTPIPYFMFTAVINSEGQLELKQYGPARTPF